MGRIDEALEAAVALRIARKENNPVVDMQEAIAKEMDTDVLGDAIKEVKWHDKDWDKLVDSMVDKGWTPMHPVWKERKERYESLRKLMVEHAENIKDWSDDEERRRR